MKTRRRTRTASLPMLMAELTIASWETIARRTAMMAGNSCSPAEYRRMVQEKAAAMIETAARQGAGAAALLRPWHRRATANAKRLRRK